VGGASDCSMWNQMPPSPSWPGLTRPSTSCHRTPSEGVDPWVEPEDDGGWSLRLFHVEPDATLPVMAGLDPAIHVLPPDAERRRGSLGRARG
jgi:hypothetical protein